MLALLTLAGFFVLALCSLSMLPLFKSIPDAAQQEKFMARLMIPLAIADVSNV